MPFQPPEPKNGSSILDHQRELGAWIKKEHPVGAYAAAHPRRVHLGGKIWESVDWHTGSAPAGGPTKSTNNNTRILFVPLNGVDPPYWIDAMPASGNAVWQVGHAYEIPRTFGDIHIPLP